MGRARWERANVVGTRDVVARYAARTRPQTWPCTQRLSSLYHDYNDYASCYREGRKSLDRARLAIHLSESHSSGNERVMRGIFLLQFRAHVIGGFGGEGEGEEGRLLRRLVYLISGVENMNEIKCRGIWILFLSPTRTNIFLFSFLYF